MIEDRLIVKRENDFSYPIVFRTDFEGLSQELQSLSESHSSICIVTDSNVAPLYLEQTEKACRSVFGKVTTFVFTAGEQNKHLGTISDIYRHLIGAGMDRRGLLAALGGGVTGDMTGFAAATYLRGIDFIQIPTTLLAQVDSSVGGKTGVDLDQYKNMVGAFLQPSLVYMNMSTLATLPDTEFACGMGEVLKTGLICDGEFFRETVRNSGRLRSDMQLLKKTVRRCCEIKAGIVERDPKEKGERALLNLGHTAGHAVEKLKNFELLHGQCVAVGLVVSAELSREKGLLSDGEFEEIREGIEACGIPVSVSDLPPEDILAATKKDKKMDSGHIRFILMDGIGHSRIDRDITDEELLRAIRRVVV